MNIVGSHPVHIGVKSRLYAGSNLFKPPAVQPRNLPCESVRMLTPDCAQASRAIGIVRIGKCRPRRIELVGPFPCDHRTLIRGERHNTSLSLKTVVIGIIRNHVRTCCPVGQVQSAACRPTRSPIRAS